MKAVHRRRLRERNIISKSLYKEATKNSKVITMTKLSLTLALVLLLLCLGILLEEASALQVEVSDVLSNKPEEGDTDTKIYQSEVVQRDVAR